MAGLSRSKNGVLSHAYVPAIHVFELRDLKTWMPSEVGLARLPHKILAASRVNPTCSDKRGHDEVAHGICVVMRGHSRPKYGVLSHAYDPRMTPLF